MSWDVSASSSLKTVIRAEQQKPELTAQNSWVEFPLGVWRSQAAGGSGPELDPEASEFHLSGSDKYEKCGTQLPWMREWDMQMSRVHN